MGEGTRLAVYTTNSILRDKKCLLTEELELSNVAQSLPFTGLNKNDVGGVLIKVQKVGAPTDVTNLVRYTQSDTGVPTTTHGMWMGDGDVFEVNNNFNFKDMKVISSDGGLHILTIEYYGRN